MSTRRNPPVALVLSVVLCALCLAAVPILYIIMPSLLSKYLTEHEPTLMEHITLILTVYYIALTVATAVQILLIFLLRVIRQGRVFTPISGKLVCVIALLVLLEGAVIAVLGSVYPLALALTLVAVVMGLCLLVVGQVLREATEIKTENDGTI